jgi:hypothetical protein
MLIFFNIFKKRWLNTKELVAFLSNLDRFIACNAITVSQEIQIKPKSKFNIKKVDNFSFIPHL